MAEHPANPSIDLSPCNRCLLNRTKRRHGSVRVERDEDDFGGVWHTVRRKPDGKLLISMAAVPSECICGREVRVVPKLGS